MAIVPDFAAARFPDGTPIDNPFLPLPKGRLSTWATNVTDPQSGRTAREQDDLLVTFAELEILGVTTTVLRDSERIDGRLVEDTLDFVAQDEAGNVWYFGELSWSFDYDEDGRFEGAEREGSWLAGRHGARPGILMKAEPTFGAAVYQERAPGVAEDESIVVGRGGVLETPLGRFTDVLTTLETTALEPEVAEFKHYAPGTGLVRIEEELGPTGEPGVIVDLEAIREVTAPAVAVDRPDRAAARRVEAREIEVEFLSSAGELDDAVGAYTYDLATGRIGEGRILFASDDATAPGTTVTVEVGRGQGLGLFLLADVETSGLDLSAFLEGGLFFRDPLGGGPATLDDLLAPLVVDGPGRRAEPLPLQPLHAEGARDGANFLGPGAGLQAVVADGRVGFEEWQPTDPLRDSDFDDVVLAVRDPAAERLAALLAPGEG